ncbi:MAG: response regulator [Candidatus Acidiferrales bacterium]
MSETQTLTAARTPTVYFIDDSATMREVIKIAFRKENIHVITCADAASALAQFGEAAPDAVITDVIMPDKDGYEVCQFIKDHARFGKTPVILMSGVVNRTVAEKAMLVKADELVRKPFQPQDLIARVKSLLNPGGIKTGSSLREEDANATHAASRVLGSLFSANSANANLPEASALRNEAPAAFAPPRPVAPAPRTYSVPSPVVAQRPPATPAADVQKLRNEVLRLELLVKKLQAELEAQKQYCSALEAHFKAMQESA